MQRKHQRGRKLPSRDLMRGGGHADKAVGREGMKATVGVRQEADTTQEKRRGQLPSMQRDSIRSPRLVCERGGRGPLRDGDGQMWGAAC